MKPVSRKTRSAFANGPQVSVVSVDDNDNDFPAYDDVDTYNEDGDMAFVGDNAPKAEDVDDAVEKKEKKPMTDEEIKIKALNQAINMAKLMSDIDTEAVIEIAKKVAAFIKG